MYNYVIDLKGGLGNQLFQYTFGLNFPHQQVYYDLSSLKSSSRYYAISQLLDLKLKLVDHHLPTNSFIDINLDKTPSHFDPSLFNLRGNIHFSGYFQNYKYIDPHIEKIKDAYQKKFSIANLKNQLISSLSLTSSNKILGIHIRRGDYKNPKVRTIHGIVSIDSYMAIAKNLIREYDLYPIIFSDDDLSELCLPFKQIKINTSNSPSDITEFRLMSACDYLICSNSTFSYWAALLSKNMQKYYIPKIWMKSKLICSENLINNLGNLYDCELL